MISYTTRIGRSSRTRSRRGGSRLAVAIAPGTLVFTETPRCPGHPGKSTGRRAQPLCCDFSCWVQHIADHDLTVEDVEYVLSNPSSEGVTRSTGLPVVWGYTSDDRYIIVVYEEVDRETIRVITAYEVPEPRNH